jgi:anti-sigma factor RsiW
MNCEQIRAQSTEFVDGRLGGRRARRVKDHLASCADCRTLVRDEQTLKLWLAHAEPPAGPEEFWSRTLAALRERGPGARRSAFRVGLLSWRGAAAWSTAAAAAALLLAVPVRMREEGDTTPGNTQHVIAWHAGYCSRQPLSDEGQMDVMALRAQLGDTAD